MKIILLLFSTWWYVSSAFGQQVHIRGSIAGYNFKEIQFYTVNNYVENKHEVLSKETTDKEGSLVTKIKVPKAQPIMIAYEGGSPMTLWVEQNDSIIVNIVEANKIIPFGTQRVFDKGKVIFSGKGAGINRFLFAANLSIYDPKTNQTAQNISIQNYMIFLDSIENARLSLRKEQFPDKFSLEGRRISLG